MPDLSTFLTFYAAVLALQLAPGPDMVLLLSRGVGQGRRIAVLTAIGMTLLAGLVQLPLLALGVTSLIQASPLAFELLRWAGAAYLVWLGAKLLIASFGPHRLVRTAPKPVSDLTALRQGMINNLTNPKAMVFMLAFLPQFVDPGRVLAGHGAAAVPGRRAESLRVLCPGSGRGRNRNDRRVAVGTAGPDRLAGAMRRSRHDRSRSAPCPVGRCFSHPPVSSPFNLPLAKAEKSGLSMEPRAAGTVPPED
ncbi:MULTISPECIES: LysE family translocator [Microvirga]|uniref:LysE family translocator n=1 Tax=Microvirga TaxID=186650 RepID=UPI0029057394|nr:LysE family translocator [Microvirga sp. HBU67655]